MSQHEKYINSFLILKLNYLFLFVQNLLSFILIKISFNLSFIFIFINFLFYSNTFYEDFHVNYMIFLTVNLNHLSFDRKAFLIFKFLPIFF
jgi:hypothetical protein